MGKSRKCLASAPIQSDSEIERGLPCLSWNTAKLEKVHLVHRSPSLGEPLKIQLQMRCAALWSVNKEEYFKYVNLETARQHRTQHSLLNNFKNILDRLPMCLLRQRRRATHSPHGIVVISTNYHFTSISQHTCLLKTHFKEKKSLK